MYNQTKNRELLVYDDKGYSTNVMAKMTLKGPGRIKLMSLQLEVGFDTLRLGPYLLTGYLDQDYGIVDRDWWLDLPEGDNALVFTTDYKRNLEGAKGGFRLEYFADDTYEMEVEATAFATEIQVFPVWGQKQQQTDLPRISVPIGEDLTGGSGQPAKFSPVGLSVVDTDWSRGNVEGSLHIQADKNDVDTIEYRVALEKLAVANGTIAVVETIDKGTCRPSRSGDNCTMPISLQLFDATTSKKCTTCYQLRARAASGDGENTRGGEGCYGTKEQNSQSHISPAHVVLV